MKNKQLADLEAILGDYLLEHIPISIVHPYGIHAGWGVIYQCQPAGPGDSYPSG